MANALYNQMIDILVNSGDVPEDQAKLNVNRLLKMKKIDEDSISTTQCASVLKNLEGIVILRGNKNKLSDVKPLLAAII